MNHSIRTTLTFLAGAALVPVVIVGAQYAGAAPSPHGGSSPAVAGKLQPATSATSHASLLAKPKKNIAYVYTTASSGGTGQIAYSLTNPPVGVYAASVTANFFPEGTPAAPETFSCYLIVDGFMATQSTSSSTYTSGFYVGVNGSNTIQVTPSTVISPGCGVSDGTAWTWGTRPLQITLTGSTGFRTFP